MVNTTKALRGAAGVAIFLGIWELSSRFIVGNQILFPPPSAVFVAAIAPVASGELALHAIASGRRALFGFAAGAALAILLGVATAASERFRHYTEPLLNIFRSIPALALVPFWIFWFGIGDVAKILLVAWTVFFPVWVNTDAGIRDVSPVVVRAAASLGADNGRMLLFVLLPAALPYIVVGMRVSLSAAIATLVAAELAGAVYGLGYMVSLSQQVFRVDLMFVALIALGLWSVIFNLVFELSVRSMLPWYGAEQRQSTPAQ